MSKATVANIKKVGVIGCGQMGSGIAQIAAAHGYDVVVAEAAQDLLDRGLANIRDRLDRLVKKGSLPPQQREAVLSRLHPATDLTRLADCDLLIEAIIENVDEKLKLWRALDGIAKPEAILASNTSSVSITQMMTATRRPERFLGLHFFNPVPVMELVEVVRTPVTAPAVYEAILEFVENLEKKPVRTTDRPGFIVNRLLIPYLLDSIRALEEGVGSMEDIDQAMKLGCGHPMGPFVLMDFIGLDTVLYIANILSEEFREPRFAPPGMLKRLVMMGWLGRKTGKGFYDYSDPANPKPVSGLQ